MNMECVELASKRVVCKNQEAALIDIGEGIGCVEFRSKGNSISPAVRQFIWEITAKDLMGFDGLVIANQGKHFSVGANLLSIKEAIEEKDFSSYEKRIQSFQAMTNSLKYSKKPIVAAPHGMVLGGGLEVALHAHVRVALNKSHMGLVEAGVGLIPGGGGTKEAALLIGGSNGENREALMKAVFHKLITRTVSKDASHALALHYLNSGDIIVTDASQLIGCAKMVCLELVKNGFTAAVKQRVKLPGKKGYDILGDYAQALYEQGELSPYDLEIGKKLALVLCGSQSAEEPEYDEEQLLALECTSFLELVQMEGTYKRICHFLDTNTLLQN